MSENDLVVLKFGSSVLRGEQDLPAVVNEIYNWWLPGFSVVAVVSAFGNTTDELAQCAHSVCNEPQAELLAELLATGEAASSTLLGLALQQAGIPATVLNAEKARLTTIGPLLDAELKGLDKARLFADLQNGVVVLPGFVGRGNDGVTTLLGRGGSDLTALFVSHQLGGHCRLVKDVDGLYTSDPNKLSAAIARRFVQVSYETARQVGGSVVQIKAIDFAEKHRLAFTISSIGSAISTEVGPCHDCIDTEVETVEEEECAA
jgi:homoserine dehydrogenase